MFLLLQLFWVAFSLYLAWICITRLKRFPRGILEYVVWAGAVAIIVSWIR